MDLDHDVEQCILFQGYSPPNISKGYATLKISVNFSFPANSSCSLHLIKLKLDLWLDHVEQGILFRGYSLPNISVTGRVVGLFIVQYRSICVAEWLDYLSICVAVWLDYSLSNTEESVWPRGWIFHCPIQKHLWLSGWIIFLVQYRSTWMAKWLDYIPCPIQKHLCSWVVGLFIVQYRSICAAEWLDYSLSNTEASG